MASFFDAVKNARNKAQAYAQGLVNDHRQAGNRYAADAATARQKIGGAGKFLLTELGQGAGRLAGLQVASAPGQGEIPDPGYSLPESTRGAIREGGLGIRGQDFADAAMFTPAVLNRVTAPIASRIAPRITNPYLRRSIDYGLQGAVESQLPKQRMEERLPNLAFGTAFGGTLGAGSVVAGRASQALDRLEPKIFPEGGRPWRFNNPLEIENAYRQQTTNSSNEIAVNAINLPFLRRQLSDNEVGKRLNVGDSLVRDKDGSFFIRTATEKAGLAARPGQEPLGMGKYSPASNTFFPRQDVATLETRLPEVPGMISGKGGKIRKPRGFVNTVQGSENVSIPTKAITKGSYAPKSNVALQEQAKSLISGTLDLSKELKKNKNSDQVVAASIKMALADDVAGNPETAAQLLNNLARAGTEGGRFIQAFSLLNKMTPEALTLSIARQIQRYNEGTKAPIPELNGVDGGELLRKFKEVDKLPEGEAKNIARHKVMQEALTLIPSSLKDKVIGVWKAGLLTGIKTTGTNILGTGSNNIVETFKDIPAAGIDALISVGSKKRTVVAPTRGQLAANLKGNAVGAKKGWNYLRTGYDEKNLINPEYSITNYGKSKGGRALQAYTNTVFRGLGAQDMVFSYGASARSLHNQAEAAAKTAGVKGKEAKKFIENFVQNPSDEALEIATKDAKIATFQNNTRLGDAARGAQKAGFEPIIPFARTPSAVAMAFVNYSPVGAVKTVIESIGRGNFDQRTFSQGLGRSITGTGVMAIGAALGAKGLLSGPRPSSETERNQRELEGKKDNAILINGKWRSLSLLGPYGALILAGAAYDRVLKETGSVSSAVAESLATGGNVIAESPFLQGVSNASDAIKQPGRYAQNYLEKTIGSFVPTLIADTAVANDPYQRETNSVGDAVQNRLPGLRNSNIPKRDVLGQPLERTTGTKDDLLTRIQSAVDPTRPATPRSNTVTDELSRLMATGDGATPSRLDKKQTINKQDISFDPNQLNQLEIASGGKVSQVLNAVFSAPDYGKLTEEQKVKITKNVIEDIRAVEKIRTAAQQGLISPQQAANAVANIEKAQRALLLNNKLKITAPKPTKEKEAGQKLIDQTTKAVMPGAQTSDPLSRGLVSKAMAATPTNNGAPAIEISFEADDDDKAVKNAIYSLTQDRNKRGGDFSQYQQTASDQIDYLEDYLEDLDPESDPAEYYNTLNTIEDLQYNYDKLGGQGGFKKGKKPVTLANGKTISRANYTKQRQSIADEVAKVKLNAEREKRDNKPQLYLKSLGDEYNQLEQKKGLARTQAELTGIINKQEDLIAEAQKLRKQGGFKTSRPKIRRPSAAAPQARLPQIRRPKVRRRTTR